MGVPTHWVLGRSHLGTDKRRALFPLSYRNRKEEGSGANLIDVLKIDFVSLTDKIRAGSIWDPKLHGMLLRAASLLAFCMEASSFAPSGMGGALHVTMGMASSGTSDTSGRPQPNRPPERQRRPCLPGPRAGPYPLLAP